MGEREALCERLRPWLSSASRSLLCRRKSAVEAAERKVAALDAGGGRLRAEAEGLRPRGAEAIGTRGGIASACLGDAGAERVRGEGDREARRARCTSR